MCFLWLLVNGERQVFWSFNYQFIFLIYYKIHLFTIYTKKIIIRSVGYKPTTLPNYDCFSEAYKSI